MTEIKKILVIGGTGLVGKAVVQKLIADDMGVYLVTRNTDKAPGGTIPIKADISSIGWEQICKEIAPQVDAIIYMAYSTSRDKKYDRRINYEGLKEITDVIKTNRLVFLSTIGVFGSDTNDNEYTENSPKVMDSVYVKDKIDAENFLVVFDHIEQKTILYLSNVYEKESSRVKYYSSLLRLGYLVYKKNGSGIYNIVHADDVANAVVLSLHRKTGKAYESYIVNEEYIKHKDWCSIIENYYGYDKKPKLPAIIAPVFKWHIKKLPTLFGLRAPFKITEPKATLFEAKILFNSNKIINELKWSPQKKVKDIVAYENA